MLKLYRLTGCPYCAMVQKKLAELHLDYEAIEVPAERQRREEVFKVSGQYFVPVLVDGDRVLDYENVIIDYLETRYNNPEEKPA
jgi:glutathione S-transferase